MSEVTVTINLKSFVDKAFKGFKRALIREKIMSRRTSIRVIKLHKRFKITI